MKQQLNQPQPDEPSPYAGYPQYYAYNNYSPPLPVASRRSRRFGWGLMLVVFIAIAAAFFAYSYFSKQETIQQENKSFGFVIEPNDPLYSQQYALQHIDASNAWKITTGNSAVVVAVVDTGVDASHPDLQDKLVKGYDFVNDDSTPEDNVGHGTLVASLIAADGDNGTGVVGLAPNVKIMPLKVLDGRGAGNSTIIARAIRYATDNGAKVINLSLGSSYPSQSITQAVNYALNRNVVIVASSGNDGSSSNTPSYPASLNGVISVGATGPSDKIASFSTYNSGVDVVAPGVNVLGARSSKNSICRAYNRTPYCTASGTSFSAPYVTATAALMLSVNPDLTPEQVRTLLTTTATDLGPKGKDIYYGAGLIDAGKAVAAAQAA